MAFRTVLFEKNPAGGNRGGIPLEGIALRTSFFRALPISEYTDSVLLSCSKWLASMASMVEKIKTPIERTDRRRPGIFTGVPG